MVERRIRFTMPFERGLGQEIVTSREVPVDGRHRDAASSCDVGDGQTIDRTLGDEIEHGRQDLVAREGAVFFSQTQDISFTHLI